MLKSVLYMNDLSVHGSAWQLSLGHTQPILVEVLFRTGSQERKSFGRFLTYLYFKRTLKLSPICIFPVFILLVCILTISILHLCIFTAFYAISQH